MTLSELLDAATAELRAFADVLDGIEHRHLPTPCAGWTVRDLAAHVAVGAYRNAEATHRARIGSLSPPGELDLGDADPVTVIRQASDHMHAAFAATENWPPIPLPFGTYPVDIALGCLIIEYGTHLADLKAAAGLVDSALSEATRAALFDFGERYLLLQAEPLDSGPVTLTLAAPAKTMSITWTGDGWTEGAQATEEHRVDGDDETVARLMLRRLPDEDPLVAAAIRPL